MATQVVFANQNYTTDVKDVYRTNLNLTEIYLLNDTSLQNITIDVIPQWHKILDGGATVIMVINTIALMMGMGAATYWKDVINNLWPPIGIVIGMCGQFLILPFLAFCLSILFAYKPYEAMGVLIVSCCPGGSLSNFLAFWMDGDVALSIVMTTCSSIIAFGGMPLNLWLYSQYWVNDKENDLKMPFMNILISLVFISVPVAIGMIIRHFSEAKAKIVTKVSSFVGFFGISIVLVVWLILYWKVFVDASPSLYAGAIILPISGFTLAYLSARLFCRPHKACRTIGVETGSQNMPVAFSIITLSFTDPHVKSRIILFPTLYGTLLLIEMFILIGSFQTWQKRCGKNNKDQNSLPMEPTNSIPPKEERRANEE